MTDPEIPVLDGQTTIEEVLPPKRVQRRRVKGWRMPENTIYVGRGSKWGNRYKIGEAQLRFPKVDGTEAWEFEGRLHKPSGQQSAFYHSDDTITWHDVRHATRQECVDLFREEMTGELSMLEYRHKSRVAEIRAELAGKNLACWCPLYEPCHADVLLEIANGRAD